jgi:hypothetical protein
MTGITNPKEPLIAEELNSDYFEIVAGQVKTKPSATVVKNTNTALSGGYTVPSQTVVSGVTTYTNLVTIPQSTPITIPAPANYPKNTELYLKTTGAWTGSIVITPAGGQIDQAATFTLGKPSAVIKPSITVIHDGLNWYSI